MPFNNPVMSREYFRSAQLKFRRRREGKTDYYARRRLIVSDLNKFQAPKYRFVVRRTAKDIICQIIYSKINGDCVLSAAYSHELPRYGMKLGLTNYAAAYCTGLLLARRTLQKVGLDADYTGVTEVTGEEYHVEAEGDRRPFRAFMDVGLTRTTTGNRMFAALKGAVDGGLDIPHSTKRFAGNEEGQYDAETHRERIMGGHIAEYMNELKEENPEAYEKQFSRFIKEGIVGDDLVGIYEKVHAAIRADPAPAAKKEHFKGKDYSRTRMSLAQRKDRVKQKKASRAWKLQQELDE
ncbi:Ribosomal protein L18/L5 [Carpediemonas membranifera]|uniref:Ribosomal protein L18/L5 n=1 Tax=Carpediemonas membranifera TaxID=201153 RepID=A0A8J6AQ66_9EUKA|nr:Ribosomal protein L18/L5 [Carpediemonas membranifera]KAG9395649.1 Ribosomal protein L18/L5 [Carpediemonas membranifera]|eukprot:KAG9391051.1 Ribosomal protein L18/L5 [Carpediemonas membranifera]